MTIILGVDPGITGALCAYDMDRPAFVAAVIDMPTVPFGTKQRVDGRALRDWIQMVCPHRVLIERVNAMPPKRDEFTGEQRGAGGASMFNFGGSFFSVITACEVLNIPFGLVVPTVWKKHFDLLKQQKEASRQAALAWHPEAELRLMRKKDAGRAEAILLARYGMQRYQQIEWQNV